MLVCAPDPSSTPAPPLCAPGVSPPPRFVTQVGSMPPEQVVNGGMKMRTKMLHKYLNPVEAEVCVCGGGG
jgi:hypothetical protein